MQSFSSAYELQIFQCLKYKVYVRRLQYRQGEESAFMWITSGVSLLYQYGDGDDVPDDIIMRWAWSCLWWFLTLTLPSPGCEAVLKYTTPSSEEKLECELSACIISDYSNKSVDLFWFPLWSTRCFGSPTSTKYFNSILRTCDQYVWNVQWRQRKGTPCSCYISSIFITSCWWWWFWLIWGSYHHLNTLITHMRLDTVCLESSVGLVIMEYPLPLLIRIEGWGPCQKVSGQSPITSTARLHFPRCDFTCQNKGSLEVVQLVYW